MMGNKWFQAALIYGFGFGMIIGATALMITGTLTPFLLGFVVMMAGMWKTANCRGTDGWGGPWRGPKKPARPVRSGP